MRVIIKACVIGTTFAIFTGAGLAFFYLFGLYSDLPDIEYSIKAPSLQTSYVFDRDGKRIGCLAAEWRDILPTEKIISTRVAKIIVAKEDHRYWERAPWFWGFNFILDFYSLAGAAIENYSSGNIVRGGSTIPQQLAKQILSPDERKERSLKRKIREMFIAKKILVLLNKSEILALYLNWVPLGENHYGIQSAAQHYYSKNADELSVREAALLAGMIRAPAIFSIRKHSRRAKIQLNETLMIAYQAKVISADEYNEAHMNPNGTESIPLDNTYDKSCFAFPYAVRSALDQMRDKLDIYFDERQMNFTWTGINIHTTIDNAAQKYAEEAISKALQEYHNRLGEKAIDANGAMIVIDNNTGKIIAIVGGANFAKNQYNVALNGKRQAGSAFKPIVYASYLEKLIENGASIETILDQQISNTYMSCRGATKWQRWNPKNFDEKKFFLGSYPIRKAIAQSINRCALHAASIINAPCALDPRVVAMARRLGINALPGISIIDPALYKMLPIAIGGIDITPLELARAYSVFPNKGILKTYSINIIDRIANNSGETLYNAKQNQISTLDPKIAQTMVEALRGVVTSGTAKSVLSKQLPPIAGKTGTTNNYSDAWFCGFVADITSCVWIGSKDKTESLGDRETGGRVAAPAFKYFVEQYYPMSPL